MSQKAVPNSHLIALEPRMMFDGAGVVTAVAVDAGSLAVSPIALNFSEATVAPLALEARHDTSRVLTLPLGLSGANASALDSRSNVSGPLSGDGGELASQVEVGDEAAGLRLGSVGFDRVLFEGDDPSGSGYIALK